VASFSELLRKPFSFLFARSSSEDRLAAYVVREHERGRAVSEILNDPYIQNRASRQQISRVLERPEVIKALGEATAATARADV
jgi:crotonobetainyl-CoA:carnitine CoA-transferase CaiB-like acyl-CoA transferase